MCEGVNKTLILVLLLFIFIINSGVVISNRKYCISKTRMIGLKVNTTLY